MRDDNDMTDPAKLIEFQRAVACDCCEAAVGENCRAQLDDDCACCRYLNNQLRSGRHFCGGGARELAGMVHEREPERAFTPAELAEEVAKLRAELSPPGRSRRTLH